MSEHLWAGLTIMLLAFAQNVSFSIVSRSRNRDNMTYHLIASIFSNGIWFLTFRELVTRDMPLDLFVWYTTGTVAGSLSGAKISIWIENMIGAKADHSLADRVTKLEECVRYPPVVIYPPHPRVATFRGPRDEGMKPQCQGGHHGQDILTTGTEGLVQPGMQSAP